MQLHASQHCCINVSRQTDEGVTQRVNSLDQLIRCYKSFCQHDGGTVHGNCAWNDAAAMLLLTDNWHLKNRPSAALPADAALAAAVAPSAVLVTSLKYWYWRMSWNLMRHGGVRTVRVWKSA
jgi:hypothetical protein